MPRRLSGLTFHRSFSLSRPSITEILRLSSRVGESGLSRSEIRNGTSLGTVYVEAMPRYASACGLLDENNALTPFGRAALEHDPQLSLPATQWLMHYYFSAPQGPGPTFWHDLVVRFLYPGNRFTDKDIERAIAEYLFQSEGKSLAERSVRSTATIFLGTYTKPDGLGYLNLLDAQGGSYEVREGVSVPADVVAVAIADYWQHHFPGHITINESALLEDSRLPDLFQLGRSAFEQYLRELQRQHLINWHRTAPPYQIALLHSDPADHIRQLYRNDDDSNDAAGVGSLTE